MEISCRKSNRTDAKFIAEHMRVADVAEIAAGGVGLTPYEVLLTAVEYYPQTYTLCMDGEPAGIFGFHPKGSGAVVWFLGTDASVQRSAYKAWLYLAPLILDYGLRKYGTLYNKIWVGNSAHMRWLIKLNATLGPTHGSFRYFKFTRI